MIHHACKSLAISSVVIGSLGLAYTASGQELRPNLRALPAFNLSIALNADSGDPELRFSATSWNSGAGPLELVAGAGGQAGQDVYQRIYNKTGGGFVDHLAGTFLWHPTHFHFHFQQYAVYTLQPVNAPGGSQRQSYKTSFCIMDTTKVDARLPGAPNRPAYGGCNPVAQGMSVGWGDTYGSHLDGQAIDLAGAPDGLYELTLEFDPANKILETNDNDNKACVRVQINVAAATAQSVGACGGSPGGGAVTIASVTPSSAWAGTVTDVVITGTNFTPGIAVGFENGSGLAPVPSNVIVQSSTTISLTVTIKQNGRNGDPVWDVRVGSAVLRDGFQVLR
jgi:lysyl oxidase